jgi:hypothetical protein
MEIRVSDSAAEYLKGELQGRKDSSYVRVYVAGMG